MPYREPDSQALVRAEHEIRAREELDYRVAVGRQARSLARVLSHGSDRLDAHDPHHGVIPYRDDLGPRAFAWTLGSFAGIAGYMATLEWLADSFPHAPGPPALIVALVTLLIGQRVGRWAAPSLLRMAALPWLRRLPFPLRGFLALHLLRRAPATVALRVELETPDDELTAVVADLVWQVDDATAVQRDGATLVLRSPGENRQPKPLPTWAREIVDDVLVPLHALHPILSVAVAVQR